METDSVIDQSQPTVPPTSATSPVSPVIPASKPRRNVLMLIIGGIIILGIIIAVGIGLVLWRYPPKQITSYEECVKAKGSYIQESNPPTCVTSKGLSFKKTISPITQPSESETSPFSDLANNWKTYTDKLGFSLKYPSDWKTDTGTNAFKQGDATSIYTTVGYDGKVSSQNFLFTVAKPVQTTLGLRDWIDGENILAPYPGNEAPRLSKDATLGGEPAIRIDKCVEGCFTFLFSKHNDKIYAVGYPSDNTFLVETFYQILSTFKFLDEESSNSVYECPTTQYVNCMPMVAPGEPEKKCEKTYLDWAAKNCPTFKGPVY